MDNSYLFIIHGDASYLYHNKDGSEVNAHKEQLEKAKKFAKTCLSCDVFIIFNKKSFLKTSANYLYHYKNSSLIRKKRFKVKDSALENRLSLRREIGYYFDKSQGIRRHLLYFGHQILPGNDNYYFSRPEYFGLKDYFRSFDLPDKYFDRVFHSTCNGATLATLAGISRLTNYLFTSASKIHLSHMDGGIFLKDYRSPVKTLQDLFADLTLRDNTQVTLGFYDFSGVIYNMPTHD